MFVIVGGIVIMVSIIGGYLMGHGNLSVLFQPAEMFIIGGAAFGSFFIANPKSLAIGSIKKIIGVLKAHEGSKKDFVEILQCVFELLSIMRKDGPVGVENHVNNPKNSKVFTKYAVVAHNEDLIDFICDNLKVFMAGNVEAYEFENMMENDIETRHTHDLAYPAAINKLADALPGLGIVAAVLGVVLTMGKINEPPEVLGHHIGAALIGTFLGILACYGYMGPIATNIEHQAHHSLVQLHVIKNAFAAFATGMPPLLAVEAGRRAIPGTERPGFNELEEALKFVRKQAGA